VNHGNRDAEWREWFRAAGWINQSLASVPAAGNHEYSRADGTRGLTEHWQSQFALPRNGPAGLEESCYYLDIQGVRIVTLNSSEKREEQAAWLDRLLAQGPRRWTIVTLHHPIFSSARGRDNRELRESWQPVFEKHGVDLVLQGHDHTYGRGNLTSGVNTEAGGHGTVYVVSVSGPKMYKLQDASWMTRVAERTQFFQVIRVNKDVLEYEARTARGTLYDAFRLRKRPGKPNEFTDLAPKTPPRVSADSGE
jgi:3',5'-cyclic AMP phosphodiesterase CpdA